MSSIVGRPVDPSRAPLDRSRPPRASAVHDIHFPPFERARLSNGIELFLARRPQLPLINLEVLLPAGGQYGHLELAGLAQLHGKLLDGGTATRDAPEIAASVERLGMYLGTGADWDVAWTSATLLEPHLDAGLELAADLVRDSRFPDSEVARLRRQQRTEILSRKAEPKSLAGRFFARALYADTVFAESLIGRLESLERIERQHCVDFYRRHVRPEGAVILAVGDLDPENLHRRLEAVFGDWGNGDDGGGNDGRDGDGRGADERNGGSPPPRPRLAVKPLAERQVILVDRPGSTQTQLQLGHLGPPRESPDHPALTVMNGLFGGQFTSRINLNLREKHGLTYGATSNFIYRQAVGYFYTRAAVATESAGIAVSELLHEMSRLREEPVSVTDLRGTQDYLVGSFPSTLQTVSGLAKRLEILALFDLPRDYYDRYPARLLRSVTPEDVQRAAREHLHPDRLAVVAVGPAEELRPQLEPFGPVTVYTPDD